MALNDFESNEPEPAKPRMISEEAYMRAQSGRRVANQLQLALTHLANAQASVAEAKHLIETGEKDPEFLMGQIPSLNGVLDLAQIATRREYEEWARMASAREAF